jgi:uncharacterized membrane protein
MTDPSSASTVCAACGRSILATDATNFRSIREAIGSLLSARAGHGLEPDAAICRTCSSAAQHAYVSGRLQAERGQLSALEEEITRKAADHAAVAEHVDELFARETSRGQRIADAVARIGGSWSFVVSFVALLVAWMLVNTWALEQRAFDPYPYILLNLLLSCVAALQAPIILMSQNRTSARDRMQADQDFRVNLKAELEIASLHEKLDHLLHTRWENLIEIQEEQVELLRAVLDSSSDSKAVKDHRDPS